MRFTLPSLFLTFLLILATTVSAIQRLTPEEIEAKARQADESIWHLGKDHLEDRIKTGTWLVFYGTTWCKFCKRLTPRWLRVQNEFLNQNLHQSGFMITKVDCTGSNEGWCASKWKVDAFPTVNLYHNGQFIEEYLGDHEVQPILTYIKDNIKTYHK
ncbi:thioredoxin-like protein [Rhizoclosmatium globosum]|uniref:Thioredoxin-like protein n=1 Tax=Rhizoclosmatium globosum TaxID=329046 RepID=A0A1Y2BGD3_9FUNG|nr:thioredoxin-like protein [Rhizoclosmatium globosum]|eukprot:ORY33862.1 thioredoxin-like protein [Rhizoclosmatium globosum]